MKDFDYKKELQTTGYQPKWIAEKMGVTTQTLRNWKDGKGKRGPSKGQILLLQQTLLGVKEENQLK